MDLERDWPCRKPVSEQRKPDCCSRRTIVLMVDWRSRLAELCFSSLGREAIGADVNLEGTLSPTTHLFSESPSRIVISFGPRTLTQCAKSPSAITRRSRSWVALVEHRLIINVNGDEASGNVMCRIWKQAWRSALSGKLQAEGV